MIQRLAHRLSGVCPTPYGPFIQMLLPDLSTGFKPVFAGLCCAFSPRLYGIYKTGFDRLLPHLSALIEALNREVVHRRWAALLQIRSTTSSRINPANCGKATWRGRRVARQTSKAPDVSIARIGTSWPEPLQCPGTWSWQTMGRARLLTDQLPFLSRAGGFQAVWPRQAASWRCRETVCAAGSRFRHSRALVWHYVRPGLASCGAHAQGAGCWFFPVLSAAFAQSFATCCAAGFKGGYPDFILALSGLYPGFIPHLIAANTQFSTLPTSCSREGRRAP